MSSRVGCAVVALTAAALLALSIFPVGHAIGARGMSSWWSGHPTIEDRPSNLLEVHIGLVKSAGCHVGRHDGEVRECTGPEDRSCGCQAVALAMGFRVVKYVAFGIALLLAIALGGLGAASLRASPRRGTFGKLALVAAAASAVLTIVLLAMGPKFEGVDVDSVPMAMFGGLGLYFLGTALAITSSVLALRPATTRAPRWAAPLPAGPAAPIAPQPIDVHALLQDDVLRPTALGPEPQIGPRPPLPASPGGLLPGPSGPLGPVPAGERPSQPLFASAPQLRPLYEAQGIGNGLPVKPPDLPLRGPTPIPMNEANAFLGNASTLPALPASSVTPPPPPLTPPPTAAAPPSAPRLPPPLRNKPPSIAPPPPLFGMTARPPLPPMPAMPQPEPAPRPTPAPARQQATIISPLAPPPAPGSVPTSALASPPSPSIAKPGATLAGPPGYTIPIRPETDADEDKQTVGFAKTNEDTGGFDALATLARDKVAPIDPTDPALLVTGDATSPSVGSHSFSSVAGEDTDLETRAEKKLSRRELAVDPTDTEAALPTRTSAQVLTSASRAEDAQDTLGSGEIKIPISTAPESLPPPKTEPPTASGPSPACPQCESPMAWVEEHLRFYCKSCRMYF
jgi:hypothetical protein